VQYDSVGRAIATYLTDGGGDTGYSDALTVTGDTVLSQAEYSYNSRDELLQVTTRERFHNASGTGALGTPTTGVNARVSYYGLWYDNLGRTTASAYVGTNDNTAWTRPTSVPARGDKVLVSSQTFDAAGNVLEVTDPLGIVNRSNYVTLGRMTSQTAACGTSDAYSVSFAYGTNGKIFDPALPPGGTTVKGTFWIVVVGGVVYVVYES
jgi:YD repeat-containing protein